MAGEPEVTVAISRNDDDTFRLELNGLPKELAGKVYKMLFGASQAPVPDKLVNEVWTLINRPEQVSNPYSLIPTRCVIKLR